MHIIVDDGSFIISSEIIYFDTLDPSWKKIRDETLKDLNLRSQSELSSLPVNKFQSIVSSPSSGGSPLADVAYDGQDSDC